MKKIILALVMVLVSGSALAKGGDNCRLNPEFCGDVPLPFPDLNPDNEVLIEVNKMSFGGLDFASFRELDVAISNHLRDLRLEGEILRWDVSNPITGRIHCVQLKNSDDVVRLIQASTRFIQEFEGLRFASARQSFAGSCFDRF